MERALGGEYALRWTPPAPGVAVSVHVGEAPESVDFGSPVAHSRDGRAVVRDLDSDRRHYFGLSSDTGHRLLVAERRIALEGARNFRDVGGYETSDGLRVRWGRIYRSGDLAGLSERDLRRVRALDLALVCDFRKPEEREPKPDRLPAGTELAHLPIAPENGDRMEREGRAGTLTAARVRSLSASAYAELAIEHMSEYAEMFRRLLGLESGAALLHCAGGRDRTGLAMVLVLGALGVPRESLIADYALSGEYLGSASAVASFRQELADEGIELSEETLRELVRVREADLAAALDAIDDAYPSFEAYLCALGVDDEARGVLRRRFVDSSGAR